MMTVVKKSKPSSLENHCDTKLTKMEKKQQRSDEIWFLKLSISIQFTINKDEF